MCKPLIKWLEAEKKTQAWLAERCKVRPASVNTWVRHGIPADRVKQVSRITGIDMHVLSPETH